MNGNLVLFLIAFLLGSVPFGLLMARAFRVHDLRSQGSGNIGATNVSRVVGFWPAGALTFLLDVLKGFLPVLLVSLPAVQGSWNLEISEMTIWLVGLFAVLGHCFSPWVRFKGGKGVATGFGVILVLSPWAALGGIVAFAFTFLKTKTGSLASIAGLVMTVITHLVLHDRQSLGAYTWVGAAIIFVILMRHESNLDSLLQGQERSFG
jgi:glycerol-3-phosphate acyltransferase PlsY